MCGCISLDMIWMCARTYVYVHVYTYVYVSFLRSVNVVYTSVPGIVTDVHVCM